MVDAAAILAQLTPKQRLALADELLGTRVTPQQAAFLSEYSIDLDEYRAAADIGAGSDVVQSLRKSIEHLADKALQVREKESCLKAEYVRGYIRDVLEFCPTDWLKMDGDGDYVCDLEAFAKAPRAVKRLVESVEFKQTKFGKSLKLNFVSKNAALGLAARYTLVQKFQAEMAVVPWEQIAAEAEAPVPSVEDDVEKRLRASLAPAE